MTDKEALAAARVETTITRYDRIVMMIFAALVSKPKDPENPSAYTSSIYEMIVEAKESAELLIKNLNINKK